MQCEVLNWSIHALNGQIQTANDGKQAYEKKHFAHTLVKKIVKELVNP